MLIFIGLIQQVRFTGGNMVFNTYEQLIQGLLDKGFASVDNWLTSEELVGLRQSLLARYEDDDFHLAGIGNKEQLQIAKKIRTDRIHWLDAAEANAWEKTFLGKIDEFVAYLNRTCFTSLRSYELHYAVYEPGSFYKKHVDRFRNDDKRKFSVVFYLSESWQAGDGGELLLYGEDSVSTIRPLPGRMVFFDSGLPHEVLTSNVRRLSLTGWLKTR